MNCCDEYGQCTQGFNCPARACKSLETLAMTTATRYRPGVPPVFEFDPQTLESFVLALDQDRGLTKPKKYHEF